MNSARIEHIFSNYIDKFQELNDPENREYYKWEIAKVFKGEMDRALAAQDAELPNRLMELKKLSSNLIDSYTQPFYGLSKFAEKEPETVRRMFLSLFADDGGDLKKRQARIEDFLQRSHALRDKYYPNSYLYKDDFHSVTGYLFLYDPDHNYIFKATHALIFADCIEFYDDWGSGDTVKLGVYYRMCDQLAEAIKASEMMAKAEAHRFSGDWGVAPDTLHPDPEKHILAFDLIYCCSTYGLFSGITFTRPKTKERQLILERREIAAKLFKELEQAREKQAELEKAKEYIEHIYTAGAALHHKTYGDGIVVDYDGTSITVEFHDAGKKLLVLFTTVASGLISANTVEDGGKLAVCQECLKKEGVIKAEVILAEKNFAPYAEYLE